MFQQPKMTLLLFVLACSGPPAATEEPMDAPDVFYGQKDTVEPVLPAPDDSAHATLADQVSQGGITWTFSMTETVGQFANGDWWVVGPVELVEIYPVSEIIDGRVVHGSMVNPDSGGFDQGLQGYDSTLYGSHGGSRYQSNLNVGMGVSTSQPLSLAQDSSLISVISWTEENPPENGSISQLKTAAVLTVLSEVPPADAFRPAYSGSDKTIRYREGQLDYSTLGQLSPTGNAPTFESLVPRFERVWLDHASKWISRYMHPVDNMPDYGRDFTSLYGQAALALQLDVSDHVKRDLLVHLTQIGIDFYGNTLEGGIWPCDGGHGSGRKFPILFAGGVLQDADMLSIGETHPSGYFGPGHKDNTHPFGEDSQTFYVAETSSGVFNWGHGGFGREHLGMAEWGITHATWPVNDDVSWTAEAYRRCCTANAWVGQTLAVYEMDLQERWNHPAYFDYMDRYMTMEPSGSWTRSWSAWQEEMWDAYRATY